MSHWEDLPSDIHRIILTRPFSLKDFLSLSLVSSRIRQDLQQWTRVIGDFPRPMMLIKLDLIMMMPRLERSNYLIQIDCIQQLRHLASHKSLTRITVRLHPSLSLYEAANTLIMAWFYTHRGKKLNLTFFQEHFKIQYRRNWILVESQPRFYANQIRVTGDQLILAPVHQIMPIYYYNGPFDTSVDYLTLFPLLQHINLEVKQRICYQVRRTILDNIINMLSIPTISTYRVRYPRYYLIYDYMARKPYYPYYSRCILEKLHRDNRRYRHITTMMPLWCHEANLRCTKIIFPNLTNLYLSLYSVRQQGETIREYPYWILDYPKIILVNDIVEILDEAKYLALFSKNIRKRISFVNSYA